VLLQIVATHEVDNKNILALAHCVDCNAVAAAGTSGFIKLIFLDPAQRLAGEAPLPDTLHGHCAPIAALVYLGDWVLASGGANGDIRFWDLHTMKELEKARRADAHQAPVTGLTFVASRLELASTAEVWCTSLLGRAPGTPCRSCVCSFKPEAAVCFFSNSVRAPVVDTAEVCAGY
jgi:WD40 repeat protein